MLIFAWRESPSPSHPPSPALALALPILMIALFASQGAAGLLHRTKSRHTRHETRSAHAEEAESLLQGHRNRDELNDGDVGAERLRTILEGFKVLGASALLGITLVKLVGRPGGAWGTVMDVSVVVVAVSFSRRRCSDVLS